MKSLQNEFEQYVQTQQYKHADALVEKILSTGNISSMPRKEALQLLYRIGYVYPELTLKICQQRSDIPKPFIDTLEVALGTIPNLRLYNKADALVAIKIALLRKQSLIAQFLINRFYKQYDLLPIKLVKDNKLTIGNNIKKIRKKKNTMEVSIIVTTYNSEKYIKNCIESLLNQDIDNIEIIVVDDASEDNTKKVLRKYNSIKLIELKNNKGTYNARNIGIQNSKGKLITFQDSDDWSHPQRISKQLERILSQPHLIASLSNFFRIDENTGLPSCRQNYPLLRLNFSSMMIKRKAIQQIGFFDDERRIEADKQFLNKLILEYGKDSIDYLRLPLAIGLLRKNSLTTAIDSGFDRYGFSSSRNLI